MTSANGNLTSALDLAAWEHESRNRLGEWESSGLHGNLETASKLSPKPNIEDWPVNLSDKNYDAIYDYASADGSAAINGALRAGHMPGPKLPSEAMQAQFHAAGLPDDYGHIDREAEVHTLDALISHYTLKEPATVYRGVAVTPELAGRLKPGAVFTDKGFTSVTGDAQMAADFAALRATGKSPDLNADEVVPLGGKPAVMKITVPAGGHMIPGETNISEFVLPRGGRYRVDNVSPDGTTYEMTALQ